MSTAHVYGAGQVGDRWVPICSDRVLDWWDDMARPADRQAAGAPVRWLRPLED